MFKYYYYSDMQTHEYSVNQEITILIAGMLLMAIAFMFIERS